MKIAGKLGIYGGTFAPPHNGHLAMAKAFIESGYIEKLLIIPTFLPPHKTVVFTDNPQDRLNMLKIAFSDLIQSHAEKVIIEDYEIRKATISYTLHTAEHFSARCDELFLLCGADMLLSIDTWFQAEKLLQLCSVAYNTRTEDGGDAEILFQKAKELHTAYGTKVLPLHAPALEISSSRIREMIVNGESTELYLHPEVRAYIDEHNLYRA